jgi:hypothetical protein
MGDILAFFYEFSLLFTGTQQMRFTSISFASHPSSSDVPTAILGIILHEIKSVSHHHHPVELFQPF